MIQLIIFSAINGLSLIFGALTGSFLNLKQKTIAAFMAFGAGVLICAITFGLMEEAFRHGGYDAVIVGFLCGGLIFIGGDYFIHRMGGRKHRRGYPKSKTNETSGAAIMLGSVLDGIPESVALGISLFYSQGTGILMLAAIFLSNFPESISSVSGLGKEGFSKNKILSMWFIVGLVMALVTSASYLFISGIGSNTIGILEAFAAGAILAMLADGMIPEAYEEGGFAIAALTILGFITTFVISRL
jgi:zinc transporter, ZIP family